jgi:hypothetical protein
MLKSFKHIVKSEVDFDVTDPQHRAWAGEFLRSDSWYLAQEFRNEVPTRGEKWATELSQQTQAIRQGLA